MGRYKAEDGVNLSGLPTYLTLQEAAEVYAIDPQALWQAIEEGAVRAVQSSAGDVFVPAEDVEMMGVVVGVDPDLAGVPIRMAEAAAKYGVSPNNLGNWATAGYIRVLERGPKKLLLDEGDVQRAARIFRQARESTGSYVRAGWVLKRALEREGVSEVEVTDGA